MTSTVVERDERTVAIENVSYRWAYLFLSFGLLAAVAYRSFALSQSSWDVLALVVASGVVATALRLKGAAMTRSSWRSMVLAAAGGVIVALVLAYAMNASDAVRAGMAAAKAAAEASR